VEETGLNRLQFLSANWQFLCPELWSLEGVLSLLSR
jgi:hypothetical protein